MFCGKCGKEVKPGNLFCEHCGAPVNAQAVQQPTAAPAAAPAAEGAKKQSKTKKGMLIGIIAGGVALLAVIIAAVSLFSSKMPVMKYQGQRFVCGKAYNVEKLAEKLDVPISENDDFCMLHGEDFDLRFKKEDGKYILHTWSVLLNEEFATRGTSAGKMKVGTTTKQVIRMYPVLKENYEGLTSAQDPEDINFMFNILMDGKGKMFSNKDFDNKMKLLWKMGPEFAREYQERHLNFGIQVKEGKVIFVRCGYVSD